MKYSIVIPTYNHCDDLLKPCIDSIFKFTNMGDVELIIVANGCKDNTKEYLSSLKDRFSSIGFDENLKICWYDQPLGYSKATNAGIKVATTDYIVLLNNDTILLSQEKDTWLRLFESEFVRNPKCGIACVIKGLSEPAGKDFAIFFCVMVHRKVFNKIGLLNEEYGVGGGEDTEFSIEAEKAGFQVCQVLEKTYETELGLYTGQYPIYHKGEGTVHDVTLVPDWNNIFLQNSLKLAKKYNYEWYRWRLSNYWERAVFLENDPVFPREVTRYKWAAENIIGNKIFELGCSSGYGTQFLAEDVDYTGLDYDKFIIDAAREQNWKRNTQFINADINTYELGDYDTIIAFEVIEHLDNGIEVVEKLKQHCKRLIISVPMLEPPGFWGPHHKLHMLDESFFPGFKFKFIDGDGNLTDEPTERGNLDSIKLMLCIWDNI